MSAHLRVYPATRDEAEWEAPAPAVHVRLGDLLPLIAAAHKKNRLWLRDFLDDQIVITEDPYEVLRAVCSYRPTV
jgi:hypothetical protein